MKLIVSGGAGFIGSNLIRHLLRSGEHEVLNIDKLCFPGSRHTIADFAGAANYRFVCADIADTARMHELAEEFAVDAIFHLAAESHVDRSIDTPATFINTNVVGTFSLLEAFRACYSNCDAGQRARMRFIHVSTDEVYGSLALDALPFDEQHRYHPNSPYAASKAGSDHLARAWHATYGLPVIITNCSNNYGPYQFPEKLIPLVISKALAAEPIPVYGKGDNVRDWLYVQDHVTALCHVLDAGAAGETYNIGGNNEKTNLNVVREICHILDELRPLTYSYCDLIDFVDDRPGHDLRYAINSTKIQSELNWSASENFDTGLRKTIQWYIDNQQWCLDVSAGSYKGQRLGLGD